MVNYHSEWWQIGKKKDRIMSGFNSVSQSSHNAMATLQQLSPGSLVWVGQGVELPAAIRNWLSIRPEVAANVIRDKIVAIISPNSEWVI